MLQLKIHIANTTKLPFNIIRGTEKERFNKSAQLSYWFYDKLQSYLDNDTCSVEDYKKILDSILAEHNIHYKIKPLSQDDKQKNIAGAIGLEVDAKQDKKSIDVYVTGYKISLPVNQEDKLIEPFTILHETGHLFDHIFNPKMQRIDWCKLYNNEELFQKTLALKDELIRSNHFKEPVNISKLKIKAGKILESIPNDIAIETLLSIKNSIKTERQQYILGVKAMLKSPFKYMNEIVSNINFLVKYAKFKQRLKITKEFLKEKFEEARAK